ncbi:MAG: hypothetical protein B6D46_02105 [Polyangiaceae bacterium UTPRO1]|jgi:hypothetical protein|nr:hypothetical protein [Myxococcales bacterium]OQY68915.1 MAG: hypothetical protein B6D46_02105 [Polyangiaceae bacterium UTPRO1]
MRLSGERAALVLAVLVGACLRLHAISDQILVDDEWHMVHALRGGAPLRAIIQGFGTNDHSIGSSVCVWGLMRLGRADETILRLPSLLAGLALLGVPLWFAPRFGKRVATLWTWLLAVSPLCCFFTRLARPYAMTMLLDSVALLAFYAWSQSGRRRDAWAYYLSSCVAPVFHLAALPALLAPLALSTLERRWPRSTPGHVRRRWPLIAASLATTGALLAIPMLGGGQQITQKLQADHFRLAAAPGFLELLSGTSRWPLVVAMFAAVGIGIRTLGRTLPAFTAYVLVAVAVQGAVTFASGAVAVHIPIVAARYCAVVLPLLLLLAAVGLAAAAQRWRVPAGAMAVAAGGLLLAGGPLPWIYGTVNDFTNHISYQADYRPGRYFERFRPQAPSVFYVRLATEPPGSMTIAEAPWFYYFHSLAYCQRIHRQRVVLGLITAASATPREGELSAADPGIVLRNAVDLADPAQLRRKDVRYVVFHRDPIAETRWPTGVTERAIDISGWIARYAHLYGPPVFEDDQLVVFAPSEEARRLARQGSHDHGGVRRAVQRAPEHRRGPVAQSGLEVRR